MENFNERLNEWLAACQDMINRHFADNYANLTAPILKLEHGSKYIRVVRDGGEYDRSVYAFIDKTNGDIRKPASWKAPAKWARGCLFDDKKGLGSMGTYGPAYLK